VLCFIRKELALIAIVITITFLICNIIMLISIKSNFKLLFSFICSLIIYVVLNLNNYAYSHLYFSIVLLMYFIILSYVKFSQTGRVRVLASNRNVYSNNLIPVVAILTSSIFILLLLENINDEILNEGIDKTILNTVDVFNFQEIQFASVVSILILIIFTINRVKEK